MTIIDDKIAVIRQSLTQTGSMVAAAESLTAGRIQALLTSASGASDFFAGGITAYNIDQKVKQLGVNRRPAAAANCVSAQVVRQMAVGACRLFHVDWGVASTGYAEAAPDFGEPAPMAHICVHHLPSGESRLSTVHPQGDRTEVQRQVAEAAVELLCSVVSEPCQ